MSSGTSDRRAGVLLFLLPAVMVFAAAAPARRACAEPGADNGPAFRAAPDDNLTVRAPLDPKKAALRREVTRKVAFASMAIILILIICIVTIMIYSRRMRIRYLGYYRKVRFNRIWDVWWQKPGEKDGGKSRGK